jgi:hypothetical protein
MASRLKKLLRLAYQATSVITTIRLLRRVVRRVRGTAGSS